MSATGERVRGLIAQEAADWFVAHRGGLAATERERFGAWLRASPAHVEEYLGVAVIARDLREACAVAPEELEALIARAQQEDATVVEPAWSVPLAAARATPRWFQVTATLAAALGVVTLALSWWHYSDRVPAPAATLVQHLHTGHGEQLTAQLADGSVVHLNTDSVLTVEYTEAERRVTLGAGEAAFEVAHQAGRPFRVFAAHAQVVAVGTRFDVRVQEDLTTVIVAEGRVAVGPATPAHAPGIPGGARTVAVVEIGPNQQIRYAPEAWPATPEAANAERATSWLHRQITFEREPLERVASEFNRYSQKPIEIATPALRNLQISGAFATDDTEAFVAFLRSLEGVKVEVTETRIRVSQRPAAPGH